MKKLLFFLLILCNFSVNSQSLTLTDLTSFASINSRSIFTPRAEAVSFNYSTSKQKEIKIKNSTIKYNWFIYEKQYSKSGFSCTDQLVFTDNHSALLLFYLSQNETFGADFRKQLLAAGYRTSKEEIVDDLSTQTTFTGTRYRVKVMEVKQKTTDGSEYVDYRVSFFLK